MPDSLPDPAATAALAAERVLILDFGSQVTQLIARRLRESGVYCEIWPFNADPDRIAAWRPRGIILSGGPASLTEGASPRAPQAVFEAGRAGARHLLRHADHVRPARRRGAGLGPSRVRPRLRRSDGRLRAVPGRLAQGRARAGVDEPRRPRHAPAARLPCRRRSARARRSPPSPTMRGGSTGCCSIPRWCTRRTARRCCATSPMACWACPAPGPWPASAPPRSRGSAPQVGQGRVICGLSGGVDSSVAAVLIHEAIGDQLTCIFVDHGLLRQGEAEEVVTHVPRPVQHPAGASRCVGPVPRMRWTASPIRR